MLSINRESVIYLSFSKRKLFRKINSEISYRKPEYIRYALSLIDAEIENAPIDDSFFNEYFKLKKKIEVIQPNYLSVSLSILISSFFSYVGGLTFAGALLAAIWLLGFSIVMIDQTVTKQSYVLEPYLLKSMEEKISSSSIELPAPSKVKKKNKFVREIIRFVSNNRILTILTVIATVIVLSYTLTSHIPEIIPGIGKWYKLLADLSIGLIINFIFYIFQVYLPQLESEKVSFHAIKPELEIMVREMQEITLVTEHYFPQYKYGRFDIEENEVYYILLSDPNKRIGWARKFDLYRHFSVHRKNVNETLDKLLSSVFLTNCDKELVTLLGKLRLNRFLKAICDAEKDHFDSDATYGDFAKQYPEFKAIYEALRKYTDSCKAQFLSPLSESEIDHFNQFDMKAYEERGIVRLRVDFSEEK